MHFLRRQTSKIKIWEANRCYDLEQAAKEAKAYKKAKKNIMQVSLRC